MNIAQKLIQFAKSREKALIISKRLDMTRAKAMTKIKTQAGHISTYHPLRQLRYVPQIEQEILVLLPHEESRFTTLRREMLDLLDRAKA